MCGIAGLLQSDSTIDAQVIAQRLTQMTATLAPRGPDAVGYWMQPRIALGHRRLSIQDLTAGGAQPMQLGSTGPVVTFNGEIYNFRELRRRLEAQGQTEWRGRSDTEVILHLYAQSGLDGLKMLEGIFAFALWDPVHQRLVLMRDRLGVKPLFYGESNYGLAFGSEIKAVLAAGGVNSALDDQSLSEYLWYGNTFESRTFYRGVRALEPGHWLIIEDGKQRLGAWWRVEEWLQQPLRMRAMGETAVWLREVLGRAVARQLVADVPVGLFLSGGVDSSAIAAAAMQNRSEPLKSYAAAFDYDGGIDELPKAARVGRHLGLDHHEMRVDGSRLESTLVALSQAHDEPFADAANIPLYLMCKQLQGRAKVVLQGDGGDELFAGYRRYAVLHNVRWWRLWPRALSGLMRGGGTWGHRFARMADSVGHPDPALRMSLLLTTETLQNPPETLFLPERRRELAETTDPFVAYRHAAERFQDHEPVQQMLLTDLTVQLPSQFLTKVDRATMAAGIEARVPMLDEEVVKLALAIPAEWKVRGLRKKIILRESQRGRLPDDILDGPKTGFGVPYEHWVSGPLYPWARDLILDPDFVQRFGFDRGAVDRLLGRHQEHRDPRGFMVWKLFQLALWHHHGLRDS